MKSSVLLALVGTSALLVSCITPTELSAGDGNQEGHYKFVPWKLGVRGTDTSDGFVISEVIPGQPANRLGKNRNFTLEPGDRIVEIDGVPLDREWTLRRALGYSSGKVDIKYWDDRAGEFRTFKGVKLVR